MPHLKKMSTAENLAKVQMYMRNELSDLPSFTNYSDLACETIGGKIIFATDDWFAAAENMIKADDAVFKEELFTEFGKWMDGWESRRKRIPGNDWCIIELGCPGRIHGVEVDTKHFTGNYPPRFSLKGAALPGKLPQRKGDRIGTAASDEELEAIQKLKSEDWDFIVPTIWLKPGYKETHRNFFEVKFKETITHVRLDMFPDGGIARLRVHGDVKPDWSKVNEDELIDLVAMTNGGICIEYSDAHFGHAKNVIAPGRARKMNEGWETARKMDRPAIISSELLQLQRGEWAIYRLGHTGKITEVEIDTNHFKGNFPHSCVLEGTHVSIVGEDTVASEDQLLAAKWKKIVPSYELKAHHRHFITNEHVQDAGRINHVKLTMAPDGGISRMRLMGHIIKEKNEP